MTTYASAVATPAAGIVTALATAITDAAAVAAAIAPGTGGALTGAGTFLAGCTLVGLATATGWQPNLSDMRIAVAALQAELAVANQRAVIVSNMLAAIGTLN